VTVHDQQVEAAAKAMGLSDDDRPWPLLRAALDAALSVPSASEAVVALRGLIRAIRKEADIWEDTAAFDLLLVASQEIEDRVLSSSEPTEER